jgi:hypothetical protein
MADFAVVFGHDRRGARRGHRSEADKRHEQRYQYEQDSHFANLPPDR